jgi:nucleoside-diphosphate-sugar epimerase
MKIVILGCGMLGSELAKFWKGKGHHVTGTTTTESKLDTLRSLCDEAFVVRTTERDKVADIVSKADAVALTVSPRLTQAVTKEQRKAHYAEVLVEGAKSAIAGHPRVVFCSSYSVFGDGLGQAVLDESSRLSDADEPSTVAYRTAEAEILKSAQGAVLRLPDIFGAPGDMSFKDRLALAHSLMGGKVPFDGAGRLFRIHVLDVVRALDFVIEKKLHGIFHVCDDEVLPPTNQQAFDKLAEQHGLEKVIFRGELKTPTQAISMAKLKGHGFRLAHVNREIV